MHFKHQFAVKRVLTGKVFPADGRSLAELREFVEERRDYGQHFVILRRAQTEDWEEVS